jgi:hypothetical protein
MALYSPLPIWQESNGLGRPYAGGLLYTFESGTTTPKVTYDENDAPNSNPVVFDSEGRATIKQDSGAYTMIFTDGYGATIFDPSTIEGVVIWQRNGVGYTDAFGTFTTVASIASLRSLSENSAAFVLVQGYYTPGDGGGDIFYWDAANTSDEDYGIIIKPTTSTSGRWHRMFSGNVNVRWFGAKADGSDDAGAFQSAINYATANLTGIILDNGTFTLASDPGFNLTIPVIFEDAILKWSGFKPTLNPIIPVSDTKRHFFFGTGDEPVFAANVTGAYAEIKNVWMDGTTPGWYQSTLGMDITTLQTDTTALDVRVTTLEDNAFNGIMHTRFQESSNGETAAIADIALNSTGNYTHITGSTTIQSIDTYQWQTGSVVKLYSDDGVVLKDQAPGVTLPQAVLRLRGAQDYAMSADDTITLILDMTIDPPCWVELSRTSSATIITSANVAAEYATVDDPQFYYADDEHTTINWKKTPPADPAIEPTIVTISTDYNYGKAAGAEVYFQTTNHPIPSELRPTKQIGFGCDVIWDPSLNVLTAHPGMMFILPTGDIQWKRLQADINTTIFDYKYVNYLNFPIDGYRGSNAMSVSYPIYPVATLSLPLNGATLVANNVTLYWGAVTGAEVYRVQATQDVNFTTITVNTTTADPLYAYAGWGDGNLWYWRVRVENNGIAGKWTGVFSFTTAP